MRRALRWMLGLFGGVALLLGGAMLALVLALDAGTLTPRLVAAIEGATGRAATLGAVALRPGLTPRLVVEGATLANLPGGSRPEMARIRRLEAHLAVLPLLRGDIAFRRLAIDGAEILLERLPDGTPNWALGAPRPARAAPDAPAPAAPGPRRGVRVDEVLLTDSRLTLPAPRLGTLAVETARLAGIGSGGPVRVEARVALHGTMLALAAETGPVPPPPAASWPVRAELVAGANRVTLDGALGDTLAIRAAVPAPAALRPLVEALAPGLLPPALPPAEAALSLTAALQPRDLTLRLGPADLGVLLPGLALTTAELLAPAADAPATITLAGTKDGLPLRATVTLDAPAALLPAGAAGTGIGIAAELTAGEARAQVSGRIAAPRALAGLVFDLRLTAPDLAALAPLLPNPPPLRDVTFVARLEAPGPLTGEVRLAPLRVDGPDLQGEGEVTLRPGKPVGLTGRIALGRLDLDALGDRLAAMARAPAPAATAPSAPRAAAPPAAPATRPAEGRVIPDIPLPLAAARAFQGDLDLSADHLIVGRTDWRQMRGRLALADGTARLTDFAAVTPGGPVRGSATLDAAVAPPAVAVALRSEGRGLDLAALRLARQEAAGIEGRAEIRLDLRGRGASTRAVAATLTGEAGIAVVDGRLARAGLLRLGPDLVALLLPGAPAEGLALRCLALRLSAEDGLARTDALLLETAAGRIEGAAVINLRSEDLAARLLPDVTLLGVRVRAPVGVGGTLAAPRIGVEPGQAIGRVIGDTAANRLWRNPTVEWLRGRATGQPAAGDCAAQLRIARFGAEGPVPAPTPVVPGVPRELQGTTQDVMRGLGGVGGAIGGALGGAVGGLLGGGRR